MWWRGVGLAACLGVGVFGGWNDIAPVGARQASATPSAGRCDLILAAGTPVVDHAPSGPSAFDPNSPEQAGETGNAADYAFDLVFIDAMILHHEGAITMAEIALVAAERPEIRDLATGIIASQGAEIEQMRMWRDAWYPDSDPVPANVVTGLMDEGMMTVGAMGGMGQGSMSSDMDVAVARLCAGAGPFDLAFIQEMIPHHRGAVGMAQLAAERAEHPELMTLATAIVTAQEAEIVQMTIWQEEWYPAGEHGGQEGLGADGTPAAGV